MNINRHALALMLGIIVLGGSVTVYRSIDTSDMPISEETTHDAALTTNVTAPRYDLEDDDLIPGKLVVGTVAEASLGSGLSTAEREGLLLMREEEKLARDVYRALGEVHGAQVFINIEKSEQTHMDAVGELLLRYDVDDPVVNDTLGSFTNQTFAELYTELVERGSESPAAAFLVGAYIEDLDIVDLERLIASTTHTDIRAVYEHLQRGSRNHLRAFNRQLEWATGAAYVPEFLSTEDFAQIIASPSETGGGGGGQKGGGGRWQ